ncbi:MtrB/PioB family outer membrane beta-barrel protein, partial [bacterium]|nr:MtrB/PioB family outer membrane beta-barrel protein [bacterium]
QFGITFSDEKKDGSKISYGPIGDRPPRSLNVQFTEPIEYTTREVKLEAEYNRSAYQALFTYQLSDFGNDIQTLEWQNLYTQLGGSDPAFDQWADHRIATFGQRALAPENSYHNASASFSFDLPKASRLAATVAFGWMRQNETLLPYSTSDFDSTTVDFDSTSVLPRQQADAEMNTALLNVDYVFTPVERTNVQAFFRYYNLDNNTPQDTWWYITSDTIPGTATAPPADPTFKNQRINLAFAYDQMNFGLDTTYHLSAWRTTLGIRFEREDIDRDFREANTAENILSGSIRTRPNNWLNLRARYLFGDREGDGYNFTVTQQSYWYDPAARDSDNPIVSFSNHPDMRKLDVADRQRNQFDVSATIIPRGTLNLTGSYYLRDDDFDSNVTSSQPLLGNAFAKTEADAAAFSPGDQLGILNRQSQRFGIDFSYTPTARFSMNAFGSRESIEFSQRGLEFDENHKLDPVTSGLFNTNELGPWTRATSQWMADSDDSTNTFGFGASYEIVSGKIRLFGDYTLSRGEVDIEYSGFGTQSALNPANTFPDDYQFAFRTPPTVKHNDDTVTTSLEYQRDERLVFGLHYIFDRYRISDWQQDDNAPWFESVGSEFLLRDTSALTSTQWGNRLVNLGSFLGPSYDAHVVYATVTYRF